MSLHVIVVTLGAGNTQVSSVTNPSIRACEVRFESEIANADVQGGDNTLSATNYGFTIHADTATLSNAVTFRNPARVFDLSNIYLRGTNGQKVHVTYVQ